MMPVSSHSLAFSPLPQLLPPPLPTHSPSPGKELPIFPLLPFFLLFHLIFKRKIWINLFCVAEGTTSCELQILANTAIYLKWQIRQSNLLEMRRFFELFSFEKSLCFLVTQGASAQHNLIEMSVLCFNEKVQFGETRWALIRDFISVKEVLGNAWNIFAHWGNCMLSVKFRAAFMSPYYFHMPEAVTYIRSTLCLLIAN